MKLTEKDIKTLMDLVEEAEVFKPMADKATYLLTQVYGPNLKDILSTMNKAMCDINDDMFQFFLHKDYTREEAMLLTLDSKQALVKALESLGSSKKD